MQILWRLQLAWRQHSRKRQISPFDYRSDDPGPCSAAPPGAQSSYRDENWLRIGRVLGHRIHAKISPQAASEKAQTTVSDNRYTSPIINVFRTVNLSLLASTGNRVRAPFLAYLRYSLAVDCRVFTRFSLCVRVSNYTCRPMIADFLCMHSKLPTLSSEAYNTVSYSFCW